MRKESLKRDNTTDSSQGDGSDAEDNDQSLSNGRNNDPLNGSNGEAIDPFDALVASKPPVSSKPNSSGTGNVSPVNLPSPSSTTDGPTTAAGVLNPLGDDEADATAEGDGYEVEEIVDHKYKGKSKKLYKIRWKGYSANDDTWEPEESLSCPELIEKYLEMHPDTRPPKKEKKPKKERPVSDLVPRDTPKRASAKSSIVESDDGNASVDSSKKPKKAASAKKTKKKPPQEYEVEKIVEDRQGSNGETIFRIRWKGYRAEQDTWEPKASLHCKELIKKYWANKKKTAKVADNTEYEVEKIVGHKVERSQVSYWVKWKGYGEDANTWEIASTVHCPDLIEQYRQKYFSASSSNGKSKTTATKRPADKKKPNTPAKKTKKAPKIVPDDTDDSDGDEEDDEDKFEDTAEKEWEVENIIDERSAKGKKEYLIRWKGCDSNQDSWEPAQNVNCPDIIAKFEKKQPSATATKKTPGDKSTKRVSIKLPSTPRKSSRRA